MGIHFHQSLVLYRSSSPSSFSYPFSQRFTKFLSVFIGFQNHRIILRSGCHNLPYQYSGFSSKMSSYSSWYLRRYEISSGLTKFFRTHLGISVVVEFPQVSPKFLRTHLGISVVVGFLGSPQNSFVLILVSPSLWNFLGSHQNSFVLIFGSPSLRNFLGSHQNSFVLPLSCVEHHEIVLHLNEVFKYPNSVSRALQSSVTAAVTALRLYLNVIRISMIL